MHSRAPHSQPLRFPGCHCTISGCSDNHCPCVAAYRECDPDLCHCGAHLKLPLVCKEAVRSEGQPLEALRCIPVGSKEGKDFLQRSCCNVSIQLQQYSVPAPGIVVGASGIHNLGAFAKRGFKKNELVCEYMGEVITQSEAEKRGEIYDRSTGYSYLFNLNHETVVDSTRKGGKCKFINHKKAALANCYAKVMTVNGDNKIGIFAKRDIAQSEELSFDYGYNELNAPDWAMVDLL